MRPKYGAHHSPMLWSEDLYADYISKSGVYLGFPDVALYASVREKDVQVVIYDEDFSPGPSSFQSLVKMLNEWMGGLSTAQPFQVKADVDLASPITWILAAVRADYVRGTHQSCNHFLPLYPKSQLGSQWEKAVADGKDSEFWESSWWVKINPEIFIFEHFYI